MTIGEAIFHFQGYNADTPCAFALWLPEDVEQQAEHEGKSLTQEQIADVLEGVHRRHDATIGISWDTISCWLEDYPKEGAVAV
jgi:hypothetical protein